MSQRYTLDDLKKMTDAPFVQQFFDSLEKMKVTKAVVEKFADFDAANAKEFLAIADCVYSIDPLAFCFACGSRVLGYWRETSDFDLLIVTNEPKKEIRDTLRAYSENKKIKIDVQFVTQGTEIKDINGLRKFVSIPTVAELSLDYSPAPKVAAIKDDLSTMTVNDLKALAIERGVELSSRKKNDIITEILNAEKTK